MSRIAVFSVLCALLAACTKAGFGPEAVPVGIPEAEPTMIVLGKKLENPYTTENMRDAFTSLYPSKSGTEIQTTHLYVRFLPDNEDEMETLSSFGLDLVDYPVDYEILVDGDYYQDPSVGENITWQYAVVPADFEFPEGIRHEILDDCRLQRPVVSKRQMNGIKKAPHPQRWRAQVTLLCLPDAVAVSTSDQAFAASKAGLAMVLENDVVLGTAEDTFTAAVRLGRALEEG